MLFPKMAKVWRITAICVLIWALLLLLLSFIWYKGIFKGHFTFFDDSGEWVQMDKMGHFFASFQVSRWFIQILKWQNIDSEKARKIGVWGGVLFVSPIELLDGFALDYGFSWSDILANVAGSFFLWLQYSVFSRIHFMPKFSFSVSPFAVMRKEMLGSFFLSQLIKDYNGQTYWISFSPNVFLKQAIFPKWLHLSFGYGGENLLGGHDNIWQNKESTFDFTHLVRIREFYVSLDLDFQYLEGSNYLKKALKLSSSCLKFPFPSVGFDTLNGLFFRWL